MDDRLVRLVKNTGMVVQIDKLCTKARKIKGILHLSLADSSLDLFILDLYNELSPCSEILVKIFFAASAEMLTKLPAFKAESPHSI